MSFDSLQFGVFLVVFLALYRLIGPRPRARDLLLLGGSYAFYMSWYWQYAGLIALSSVADFLIGRRMAAADRPAVRRRLLWASVCLNLGLLGVFKYFDFFADSVATTLGALGVPVESIRLDLILPVGISFYTFQTLSYTIDLYRGAIPPEKSFVRFATFVAFFPQLVAGPIVRASEFLPQLRQRTIGSAENVRAGLALVFVGLCKKILIADTLAFLVVDDVFAAPSAFSSVDLLVALYAYSFQIYCDFSGYSDIAIGVALMMGFALPKNFDKPYLAVSASDFWRRWHITLSQWLRDYLYVSLGGNRLGRVRTSINLLLTMLLGGLWHGAAWNFVIWGAYHGLLLSIGRGRPAPEGRWRRVMAVLVTYHAVLFGWLLFRVTDMQAFSEYTHGLLALSGGTRIAGIAYLILAVAALSHLLPANLPGRALTLLPAPVRGPTKILTYSGLLMLFLGASVGDNTFIYFQF